MRRLALACCGALACAPWSVRSHEATHTYEEGEAVVLLMNKVTPMANPQETYSFQSLPFCSLPAVDVPSSSFSYIGEILEGNHLVNSGMALRFRVNTSAPVTLCTKTLSNEDAEKLRKAIVRDFAYECFLDSLPLFGKVGAVVPASEPGKLPQVLVYTLMRITIAFNDNVIIEVDLATHNLVEVQAGRELAFTYEVVWLPTSRPFHLRFNRYFDFVFFEHQVHWFSVMNSLMMLILLLGLLFLIYFRMTSPATLETELVESDAAWERVSGDVFRPPRFVGLLAACVGTGLQLSIVVLGLISTAILGSLYIDRGALVASGLYTQVLAGFFAGYAAATTHALLNGSHAMLGRTVPLTVGMLPSFMASVEAVLILVSSHHGLLYASPTRFALIVLLYLVVSAPLVVLGAKLAKVKRLSTPRLFNAEPRPVPAVEWPLAAIVVACAGVLPFGSIFMEVFYLFSALWLRKFYYVWGFLFVNFVILLLMSPSVSVLAVYVLFCFEDWRWHWVAFASAASVGAYAFAYGIYFFLFWTHMTGAAQTAFFFAYLTLFSVGLGLMCGAVGFAGAWLFVWRVFPRVSLKVD